MFSVPISAVIETCAHYKDDLLLTAELVAVQMLFLLGEDSSLKQ